MKGKALLTVIIVLSLRGFSWACDNVPEDYQSGDYILHVKGIYETLEQAQGAWADYLIQYPGDYTYEDTNFDDCWSGYGAQYDDELIIQYFLYPSDGVSPPMMKGEYYNLMMGLAGVLFGFLLWGAILENV